MAVPIGGKTRDRLGLARQALDGGVPNVADTAGPTPVGAIGGGQVLDAADNMANTGQAQDFVVPPTPGGDFESTVTGIAPPPPPTILTGEEGMGGGGTTYSEDAGQVGEDGEASTGEMDPYQSFDDMAEEFNTSLLQDALNGVDTSEQERLMQEQTDRLLGQSLMDQRASAGAAGFGESGAMMAMEGGLRSDAARQLGLDVEQLRRGEAQRAIENAFKAQGIDIEKMNAAEQARLNELIASFMMNDGELPAEGGGEGGGDSLEQQVNDVISGIGQGAADLLGRGEGAREQQANEANLQNIDAPEGANVVEYPENRRESTEAELEASGYYWHNVTDDGVTVYRNDSGDMLYVRYA